MMGALVLFQFPWADRCVCILLLLRLDAGYTPPLIRARCPGRWRAHSAWLKLETRHGTLAVLCSFLAD